MLHPQASRHRHQVRASIGATQAHRLPPGDREQSAQHHSQSEVLQSQREVPRSRLLPAHQSREFDLQVRG